MTLFLALRITLPSPRRVLPAVLLCTIGCLLPVSTFAQLAQPGRSEPANRYDLVVYGGTSAGVAAAVQAKRMKLRVVLIEPTDHLGGLTTNGLGYTDTGDKRAIGGIAREFYQAVKRHYDKRDSWRQQEPGDYSRYRPNDDAMWTFEPHVAEAIFDRWVDGLPVLLNERLDRDGGVTLRGKRIESIRLESGKVIRGKMFIDATYEGDLMDAAKVTFTVGREANSKYNELLNGVQRQLNVHNHRFRVDVDPYKTPGDPNSGLVAGVSDRSLGPEGSGDDGLQAFCYRMCMTRTPSNRVPFPKPADYDESQYELLFRNFAAGDMRWPLAPGPLPNDKTDTNNNGAFSTDFIGANHHYATASYAEREALLKRHRTYQQGLMWTLGNHPRVPESIRKQTQQWGLAKDEFVDNGHWPRQIYVRESRRMVSDYVMTERDCRRQRIVEDPVGLGSYNMDSHNVHRYITKQGFVQNEGDVQVSPGGPYLISYRSIRPRPGETKNLLVPVCLSSSHIAFGSIRMEPVYMILGQSAATAAALSLEHNVSVQQLPYETLQRRLLADKQVLALPEPTPPKVMVRAAQFEGLVMDDRDAKLKGVWSTSTSNSPFLETGYQHDGNDRSQLKSAVFQPKLAPGAYEVRLAYTAHSNRSTKTRVVIETGKREREVVLVNQRRPPAHKGLFHSLGRWLLGPDTRVIISNEGADGYVIVDAVQFVEVD